MAGETTNDLIQGLQKRVYDSSGIKDLRPKCAILQRLIGFDKGTRKIGESYQVPVSLRPPNGWTYLGSTGQAQSTLKQPRAQVTLQASIVPFSSILEERIVYAALSRAAAEGEGAFASLTSETLKGMKLSGGNRVEANMLIGQKELGIVESVTDLTGNLADIVFTEASFRPGLWWALGEGATMSSWTGATNNTGSGPLVLAGVTASARKIKVSFTGTLASEVTAADKIFFEGATTDPTSSSAWLEGTGLIAQAANTTGTSMGIAAGTYTAWAGNTYSVGGAISSDVVEDAVGQLRDRGADGTLRLFIANKGYSKLMSEAKVNRNFDSSYSSEKAKQGHKSMSYFSADVGEIEVINHPFMALGEFLLLNPDDCCRIGSNDMDFGIPGTDSEWWFQIAGTNLAGIQLNIDQGTLLKRPPMAMYGTGITYSG